MAKHITHKSDKAWMTKANMRQRRNRERLALAKTIAPVRTTWAGVAR